MSYKRGCGRTRRAQAVCGPTRARMQVKELTKGINLNLYRCVWESRGVAHCCRLPGESECRNAAARCLTPVVCQRTGRQVDGLEHTSTLHCNCELAIAVWMQGRGLARARGVDGARGVFGWHARAPQNASNAQQTGHSVHQTLYIAQYCCFIRLC